MRERYNRRYHYILVDEYQDTNRPQYEIMRLLAGSDHNVCAVGDEDQSIYSWRGADIRNILEFEQDFPEAQIIRLEQNYRSTQNILQAASAVVANNVKRKGKNLWTERQGGARIGYYEAPDGENEALFAADSSRKYLRQAAPRTARRRARPCSTAPTRSRACLKRRMRRYGLKYHVVGGFSFYDRAEIKDMISYLKLIHNPDDSVALHARNQHAHARHRQDHDGDRGAHCAGDRHFAVGRHRRGDRAQLLPPRARAALKSFRDLIEDARAMISERSPSGLAKRAAERSRAEQPKSSPRGADGHLKRRPELGDVRRSTPSQLETSDFARRTARRTRDDSLTDRKREECPRRRTGVEGFRAPGEQATTAELLKFLIDRTGYIKLLEAEDTPEALARIENLRELVNAAMDSRDRGETLERVSRPRRAGERCRPVSTRARAITLMTLHAAKGLEFPAGVPGRPGRRAVSALAHAAGARTTSKRSAGCATSA